MKLKDLLNLKNDDSQESFEKMVFNSVISTHKIIYIPNDDNNFDNRHLLECLIFSALTHLHFVEAFNPINFQNAKSSIFKDLKEIIKLSDPIENFDEFSFSLSFFEKYEIVGQELSKYGNDRKYVPILILNMLYDNPLYVGIEELEIIERETPNTKTREYQRLKFVEYINHLKSSIIPKLISNQDSYEKEIASRIKDSHVDSVKNNFKNNVPLDEIDDSDLKITTFSSIIPPPNPFSDLLFSFRDSFFILVKMIADHLFIEENLVTEDKEGAKLEIFILSFSLCTKYVKNKLDRNFDHVEGMLINGLDFELSNLIGNRSILFSFVTKRILMFNEDHDNYRKDHTWLRAQTIHAIYFEPFKENITVENSFLNNVNFKGIVYFPKMMNFIIKLNAFEQAIEKSTDELCVQFMDSIKKTDHYLE